MDDGEDRKQAGDGRLSVVDGACDSTYSVLSVSENEESDE